MFRTNLRTLRPILRPCIYQSISPAFTIKRTVFGASRASRNLGEERSSVEVPSENHQLSTPINQQSSNNQIDPENVQMVDISQHPVMRRLPKSLHKYAVNFVNRPVSYLTSFMILHEITAIAPLFGLWGLFHYGSVLPTELPEWLTTSGVDFIKVLADRNGWDFTSTEAGARTLAEGAAAYAIVKILLPVRAAFSLWLTPWFARTFVVPFSKLFRVFIPKTKLRPDKPKLDEPTWEQDLSDDFKLKQKNEGGGKPKL